MKVKLFATTMELSHGSSAVVASCCRGACFPLRQPPFPSLQPSIRSPSPVHVLSLIWMGMSMATSNTCSMPHCPPHLSHYQPIFFVQPILLSAVWFTQAWETCDHSAGYQELQAASVFGGGGREGTRKTIWHNQPTIRTFCSTLEHVDSARRDWVHLTGMSQI